MSGILGVALQGEGEDGESSWIIPPWPERMQFPRGVNQARREDMQILGFLASVTAQGGLHPLSVKAVPEGEDPPDRYLDSRGRTWATELTELTMGDVRVDLSRARSFGRTFEGRLQSREEDFEHLRGRSIVLSHSSHPDGPVPRNGGALAELLEEVLKDDKGCVGEGVDLSQGLPEQLPPNGFYGQVGAFHVQVYEQSDRPDAISVLASAQGEVTESHALTALAERISVKDDPRNELLVVTCGLPDSAGYICQLDLFLFQILRELSEAGKLKLERPEHLKAIALHSFQSGDIVELYRNAESPVPWSDEPQPDDGG